MRVLFVDDEPNVLSGIRRMLRKDRKRWPMRFANSGAEALEMLAAEPADLVVSDIRMPQMSGVELLKKVRDRWPETLRMVLSGESDREALLKAVGPTHQYLCKPCRPEGLHAALERMDAMLALLQDTEMRAVAASFDSLPTPSAAYAQAMAILDDPDGTAAELATVIGGDVGMSTAVLRVANSAYVGLSAQVSSVQRAIQLLGLDLVRAILMVAGILDASSDHPAVHRILQQSREAVQYVRENGRHLEREAHQQAELAAMLHNVGAMVLLADDPVQYGPLLDLPEPERHQRERALYGATQARIGGFLLGVWGLPAPVMVAVARQHQPPETPDSPCSLLYDALHAPEPA